MEIAFSKYHGNGNDFLLIDGTGWEQDLIQLLDVPKVCHRRYGVGADGILVLQSMEQARAKIVIYNADGSEASMCANGARCMAQLVQECYGEQRLQIVAKAGVYGAQVQQGLVNLSCDNSFESRQVPEGFLMNTGVEHLLVQVDQLENYPVLEKGRQFRQRYQSNVSFYQEQNGELAMRTYEKGVEDETYSCGTAVMALAVLRGGKGLVRTRGGELQWQVDEQRVSYGGVVEKTFEGKLIIHDKN